MAAGVEFVIDPESHLRIPYYDREGRPTGHCRIRLKEVRADEQRTINPREAERMSDFPHIPLSVCQRLWVTEGEFKALSMWEAGNPTIGVPGLHCYTRDGNGNPQILPALFDAIRFVQPTEIVFIGDADTILNIEYDRSAHFLATAFPKVAVHLLQVPFGSKRRASMIFVERSIESSLAGWSNFTSRPYGAIRKNPSSCWPSPVWMAFPR